MSDDVESTSMQQDNHVMKWTQTDTGWMLNLFGTAIGAGVLYLPITAGSGGIWPLILMALMAGPMVWLAHRNLVRFCLSSSAVDGDITTTVKEYFGSRMGRYLTLAYMFSVYPILLLYAIGITNVASSFISFQLEMTPPPRALLCLVIVAVLMLAMHTREQWMLFAVKVMVYPLVVILILISLYLVPQWNLAAFQQQVDFVNVLKTLFLTTPLLIFAFNHSPSCSAFASAYRQRLEGNNEMCDQKTQQVLKYNALLLLGVILLFVFSCVLSLTPQELLQAREENVPVLTVLSYRSENMMFAIIAPLIAFLAISSSFFGVYLGAREGLQGVLIQYSMHRNIRKPISHKLAERVGTVFILLTCWVAGYANWSVISMIEILVVPVLATILYIMPVYAIYRVNSLQRYKNPALDIFTVIVGVMAISGFLVSQFV